MGQNLKARLARIRGAGSGKAGSPETELPSAAGRDDSFTQPPPEDDVPARTLWPGWIQSGHKTLKRVLFRETDAELPFVPPAALALIVPDLFRAGKIPPPEDILFFDLETTGLSGGAGTLAFLAAFGRFVLSARDGRPPNRARLQLTQYLLLDYPGENDFIEQVTKEFVRAKAPLVVSFNGKSFDSQILKTRCLMNGIMPPEYIHADLLHPARRLWKRVLPDCSQATIETSVLGLSRAGDVPGSLAPEIWFSFLRSGRNSELLSICDHNFRDIQGLAALFLALGKIAEEPFKSGRRYRFDEEALALAWNEALGKNPSFFGSREKETARLLLETAARNGCPRAALVYALSLFKKGRAVEARKLLLEITADETGNAVSGFAAPPGAFRAAVFRTLAIDAEWRLEDFSLALSFTDSALAVPEITAGLKRELEKRRGRLAEKARKLSASE